MSDYRITTHPILPIKPETTLSFYWNDQQLQAKPDEMISSALFANGIHTFGHHPKDNSPQGIFCANGQCSQCMVIADGLPVKACMTPVKSGMRVYPAEGLPVLPDVAAEGTARPDTAQKRRGLDYWRWARRTFCGTGIRQGRCFSFLVDDKNKLGGKLVLQTHRFFALRSCLCRHTRNRYRHKA